MASKSIFICIAFLVVVCFVLMKEATTDCNTGGEMVYGCFYVDQTVGFSAVKSNNNRKVLRGLREKKVVIIDQTQMKTSSSSYGNGGNKLNDWEALRKVPSGPDPLHHNGNNHKKPRSP
ncbi:protein CLAVATA 3 [Humulus lupulus]|uniref:protein CLAVATA 3 n=1 Tax=Humulus lupulus TaxID=3486 RepID=UPI002B40E5C1|nr:protein CLAVATA 3 [Humulus lupulus]